MLLGWGFHLPDLEEAARVQKFRSSHSKVSFFPKWSQPCVTIIVPCMDNVEGKRCQMPTMQHVACMCSESNLILQCVREGWSLLSMTERDTMQYSFWRCFLATCFSWTLFQISFWASTTCTHVLCRLANHVPFDSSTVIGQCFEFLMCDFPSTSYTQYILLSFLLYCDPVLFTLVVIRLLTNES